MHIKRFFGRTIKEAMNAVKGEFGPEALILGNKKSEDETVEIVAAIDYDLTQPVVLDINKDKSGLKKIKHNPVLSQAEEGERKQPFISSTLEEEIKELRELCWTLVSRASGGHGEVYNVLKKEMLGNGIDRVLAQKIITGAFKSLSGDRSTDLNYIRSFIKKNMTKKLSVADPLEGGGIVAFIGPAGVGKTTTIAKLAAIYALKKKKDVAVLSMDNYRVASSDQLKQYGRRIGIPVDVARSDRELAACIRSYNNKDLVLVDTAGRSMRDREHMRELFSITRIEQKMKFNLVMSSQTRDESLYDLVKGFGKLPIDSLTFTKLDEGKVHGSILNAAILAGRPVAYLTDGQRVPEDIENATEDRLLNILLTN